MKHKMEPEDWPDKWAAYSFHNEKCRLEYDRRVNRGELGLSRSWPERILLNVYRYQHIAARQMGQVA